MPKSKGQNNIDIQGSIKDSYIANNLNIKTEKIKKTVKKHPEGSIGANLDKKNYVQ